MNQEMTAKKMSLNKKKVFSFLKENGFIVSFLLLCVIALYFNHAFLSQSSILSLLNQTSIRGCIALGLTFAFTCGMFDMSVGSTAALLAGVSVLIYNQTQSVLLMILFDLVGGALLGSVNGILVGELDFPPFIATLSTQVAYRSIITLWGANGPFAINQEYMTSFRKVAMGTILGIPHLVWLFVLLAILLWFVLNRTKFGRYVTAVGSNANAARLTGINPRKIKILTYMLTGACAGLTAFCAVARLTSITAANLGEKWSFDGVAAVAIGGSTMSGGHGKVIGTFFGIISYQMIDSILVYAGINPYLNGLVQGIIIVVAVLLQGRRTKY